MCFFQTGFSQKKLYVTIQFPPELCKKIEVAFDNGRTTKRVEIPLNKNIVIVSDSFYSRYATILISYPDTIHKGLYFDNSFWITDNPASIVIYDDALAKNHLQNCKLTNAYRINDMGGKKLHTYDSESELDYANFLSAYVDSLPKTDSNRNILEAKTRKLSTQELQFIKSNPDLYFSLWLFRREFTGNRFWSADSLLKIYNNIFPDSLKGSNEGEEIVKELEGRMTARKGNQASDFNVNDIKGNIVKLNNLRGKFVLLDFWASWCAPCIQEMPIINEIYKHYSSEKLEIISISLDDNLIAFNAAVKRNGMNWKLIFGYKDLIKKYAIGPIPQIYLIDKSGKIIYSREEDNDTELVLLKNLIKRSL